MGFISRHIQVRGKKSFLLKKKLTQLFTHLFFLFKKYSKASYTCHHSECEKTGHIFNRKKYGAFNRGTPIRFLRNILHFLKKNINLFTMFFILKYKYTIMCNYLNKYTNLNDAHYIRYTSLYEICTKNVFLTQPEMMGTLLICISKMATPGRLQFSYDLYRRYHS